MSTRFLAMLLCLVVSAAGFLLSFVPTKRKKNHRWPALVYSAVLLAAGIYMLATLNS